MTNELLTEIVKAIFTIIGILITAYVVPWLKQRVGEQRYDNFIDFVDRCVNAADQIYEPEQWLDKKAYVVGLVQDYAHKIGLGLDEAEIDAIIEGLVSVLRGDK